MKTLFILLSSLALATFVVVSCSKNVDKFLKPCLAESHATEQEVKEYMALNSVAAVANSNDNLKCWVKCMLEHFGDFKDGAPVVGAVLQSIKETPEFVGREANAEKAVNECKDEKGANDCETAFKFNNCVKKHRGNIVT